MATNKILLQNAYLAAADLSNATHQFTAVKRNASGAVVACDAATDAPIGVLLNQPKLGEVAEVCMLGMCPVRVTTTTVALDARIGIDAVGRFAAVTAVTLPGALQFGRVENIQSVDHVGALVTATVDFLTLKRT